MRDGEDFEFSECTVVFRVYLLNAYVKVFVKFSALLFDLVDYGVYNRVQRIILPG